ncbi:proline dehydrogenase [Nordella sp. HKS 07]|uniref:proline dehydrogenase family protein n=1 Tax=Nordella sp. HKS 07 TaxID=2712222 RepID=UPI0013E15ED7|nr:proline dehydrogenase family protein [Nordella sp. HKS 07]QIG51664.1 proline dehydrogenase [Nordella sp. HKS 07]
MIALARSSAVKDFMQNRRGMRKLAERFVAGSDAAAAVDTALQLLDKKNIRTSFYYLGEYVDRLELVQENVDQKLAIAGRLTDEALDVHVSVDPTQIGLQTDPDQVGPRARTIGRAITRASAGKPGLHCLMLDMEDASVVDFTLALHDDLRRLELPAAITLQAYLRRTERDVERLIAAGAKVRLVKGAFVGSREVAFTSEAEIKANYRKLVGLMLSAQARASGFYPIIATHDDRIQAEAIALARKNGWPQGAYEFEMLLGVRSDVAEALARQGERVRLYVPFGCDWWPYAIRRIGENPANGMLLARSLLSRR